MNIFLAFVWKEFLHIFRDTRTMMLLLIMPVIQIILFGFALSNEVKGVKVAICNPGNDPQANVIVNRISANEYFIVTDYLGNYTGAEELLRSSRVKAVVVFDGQFSKRVQNGDAAIEIVADATDPNVARSVVNYLSAIIIGEGISTPVETRLLYNPQMKSSYNFVPGVMGMILMLICAMMTSISIVREREQGNMELLLVSPVSPFTIIVAKTIPYFLLSTVNLITILLLSVFLLNVPIAGSLFWIMVVSMLFILVSLSLGLMVSTLVETQVAAMLISGMVFMMPVMILSGMMFPVENMPLFLQFISYLIPAKWFIEAVRRLMIQGADVIYVAKEILVLLGMMVILISVSVKKFKYRLE